MKGYNPRDCLKDGSAIAAAICITVIALIITFLASDANNRPAWIQAIGSISAIILAFLIATFQSERNLIQARQLRIDAEKENINKLYKIIELSYFHYNQIVNALKTFENNTNNENDTTFTTKIHSDWISYKEAISYLKKVDWTPYAHGNILVNIFTYIGMHKSNILNIEFKSRFNEIMPNNFNPDFAKEDDATIIFVCHTFCKKPDVKDCFVNYAKDIETQYQKIIKSLKDFEINS